MSKLSNTLKLSIVGPLCAHLPTKYRPVSILPTISKFMALYIKNKIVDYLNLNNMLTTVTAISNLAFKVYEAFHANMTRQVTFFDLIKAFKRVFHTTFLTKNFNTIE